MKSLRHVTSQERDPREPWISRADFLEKAVGDRVKYLRSNLPGRGRDGGLSQAELAAAVGAEGGAYTVRRWEKGENEPRAFRAKLAELCPLYEPQDFLRDGAAGVSLESVDARLQELADLVAELNKLNRQALEALAARSANASPQVRRRAGGTKR